jgi:predicted esterase
LNTKFAGIYSNVGWLGSEEVEKQAYPAYRVAMVNGDKDRGVARVMDSVTKILQERGCTVSLFAFEGGHQIPPPSVQIKSFRWLLGEIE